MQIYKIDYGALALQTPESGYSYDHFAYQADEDFFRCESSNKKYKFDLRSAI